VKWILNLLIIGAIVVAAIWYFGSNRDRDRLRSAGEQVETTVRSAGDALEQRLQSRNLGTNDIQDELARTGRVIREKSRSAGDAISDATADARVTAAIKAKLFQHAELSGLSISVNTTNGVVTLSGSVASPELIGKAMLLALETEGVRQVISTLQVQAEN
jgi:osmotically-inducible protein OsmY